ncbi:MAG: hypothetical protein KW804_00980 [Candidatus Doudnabacteria bacterium]|nr:hypothetical protein [Candidatus Doudnabacteria bacterium]
MSASKERDFLFRTGMYNRRVYAGIQSDRCVVWQPVGKTHFRNHSLCDHACLITHKGVKTGGNYKCDSSFPFADGAKAKFASRETHVKWTKSVAAALPVARDMFFAHHFDRYVDIFQVPPGWAGEIKTILTDPDMKIEGNEFGGSPSMNPGCMGIVGDLKDAGLLVNITDPGRRLMTNEKFRKEFEANPPQILALSFDDIALSEIERFSKMTLDQLKAEWDEVDKIHGQRQKAIEGLWAAEWVREKGLSVKILFNVVIHPGNIGHLNDILRTLWACVPGCLTNPYPAQSFKGADPCWTSESLPALRNHILEFIHGTLNGVPGINNRISYYIMLEAAFRKWWPHNPQLLCRFMSGIGAWDPTLREGAYRYIEVASNADVLPGPFEQLPPPGGHVGSFWNRHLSFSWQLNGQSPEELADVFVNGMVKRGQELRRSTLLYVQTSSIMPRLLLDHLSTELGIPHELVPEYLETRMEFCGF